MKGLSTIVVALILGVILKEFGFFGMMASGVYQILGFHMTQGVYYLVFFILGILFGLSQKQ